MRSFIMLWSATILLSSTTATASPNSETNSVIHNSRDWKNIVPPETDSYHRDGGIGENDLNVQQNNHDEADLRKVMMRQKPPPPPLELLSRSSALRQAQTTEMMLQFTSQPVGEQLSEMSKVIPPPPPLSLRRENKIGIDSTSDTHAQKEHVRDANLSRRVDPERLDRSEVCADDVVVDDKANGEIRRLPPPPPPLVHSSESENESTSDATASALPDATHPHPHKETPQSTTQQQLRREIPPPPPGLSHDRHHVRSEQDTNALFQMPPRRELQQQHESQPIHQRIQHEVASSTAHHNGPPDLPTRQRQQEEQPPRPPFRSQNPLHQQRPQAMDDRASQPRADSDAMHRQRLAVQRQLQPNQAQQSRLQKPQPLTLPHYAKGAMRQPGKSGTGPTPPGGRLAPPQRPDPIASGWKRLWRNVERGLDRLADLEDVISDRAQHLYSSAVTLSVAAVQPLGLDKVLPYCVQPGRDDDLEDLESGAFSVPVYRPKKKSSTQTTVPQMDMSRFRKIVTPPSQTAPSGQVVMPDASGQEAVVTLYPINALHRPSSVVPVKSTEKARVSVRKINWENIGAGNADRMIRSNGGASAPYDGPRRPPPPNVSTETKPARTNPFLEQIASQREAQPKRLLEENSRASPSSPGDKSRPRSDEASRIRHDDNDDSSTWVSKLLGPVTFIFNVDLSSLNPFRQNSFLDYSSTLDAWRADEDESRETGKFLGIFGRKKASPSRRVKLERKTKALAAPLADMIERCGDGKTGSLLTIREERKCDGLGRFQAVMDVVTLLFTLFAARQSQFSIGRIPLPRTMMEALHLTLPAMLTEFAASMDTFMPFALVGAFLAIRTRILLGDRRVQSLVSSLETSLSKDAEYGVVFTRLLTSQRVDRKIPEKVSSAARAQVLAKVATSRLQSYVFFMLTTLTLMTISIAGPIFVHILTGLSQVIVLEHWRSWPVKWTALVSDARAIALAVGLHIAELVDTEVRALLLNPVRIAYNAAIFAALAAVALLPEVARNAKLDSPSAAENDVEELEDHIRFTEQVLNLGSTSASRLGLLSESTGSVEGTLDRWRISRPPLTQQSNTGTFQAFLRLTGLSLASGLLLALPLFVSAYSGSAQYVASDNPLPRWDSLFDYGIIVILTQALAWNSFDSILRHTELKGKVVNFLVSFSDAVKEREQWKESQKGLPRPTSLSPTAGVVVKDLWAAHTSRRAWAIRGATLTCRAGEVVVVLGEDGSGKSRMLTTLAESMLAPSKMAQSTNRVRGSITMGGLDVTKWDRAQLKGRLGLLLNDVRTLSDTSQVLSGMTLEEILEPCSFETKVSPSHIVGPNERASTSTALKITGLYSSLLPRLPSKLSTVVTANEEDMTPSPLRPRHSVLSPSEWSKLLLTKVLAQAIYDNEHTAKDRAANCLVGSLLLLDDALVLLSEVEEARLMFELRQTGAASILTSNRWASGRFADRIVVVKDGAVAESGTHVELLSRGPQQSIYAAKWHAMTMQ